ncbi:MAG: hypothetical protein JWQ07_540 [Ramlibacter sp.]|nr:hypothetical protein [Ramlibacter sp.]
MIRPLFFLAWSVALASAQAQERKNYFDDPFAQVTSAIAPCPVPLGPGVTQAELPALAHIRAQHGTSCHLSGRCRLANSYLYDKEIIPRVVQYVRLDGRFNDTSVWVLGERRMVTLMGCVRTNEQALALEKSVALVDDVMVVINQLMVVGSGERPRYPVAE